MDDSNRETRGRLTMKSIHPPALNHPFTTFLLFFLLLLSCYGNSFQASWQLDDKPNITNNTKLHLNDLMPDSLLRSMHAGPKGKNSLYRPVSMLSFALNWYLGRDDPVGYHWVNFILHLVVSLLLAATVGMLFHTPALSGRFSDRGIHFVSILGAVLWAINPIQTQAVTYIVQRMAILAALFYLFGIYLYLRGRLCRDQRSKICFFSGCLLCYFLSLGSKENAVMLPVSLSLMEGIFFGVPKALTKKPIIGWVGAGAVLFSGFLILAVVMFDRLDFLLHGYQSRPFTMLERLMTEARVVIWYLGLIFYPSPHRLSVAHDVTVSTSLISPLTTLPAILTILFIAILATYLTKKKPLVSFAILFFLLNHIVESSVLPLELIFEHRNYLPSLFLFIPVAAGIQTLLEENVQNHRIALHLMIVLIAVLLVALGLGNYSRNGVWRNEITLWEDALAKTNGSARPPASLADVLVAQSKPSTDDLDRALGLYFKSLQMQKARTDIEAGIIGNMAHIYVIKQDSYSAIHLYRKALERDPTYTHARYNLSVLLGATGQLDAAEREVDIILGNGHDHADYRNLKGNILMWRQQPEAALSQFRKALALADNKAQTFIGIGAALSAMGHFRQANWFLRLAHKAFPDAIVPLFLLIENALAADNSIAVDGWVERLLSDHSLPTITHWLQRLPTYYQMPPVSAWRIAAPIQERILLFTIAKEG